MALSWRKKDLELRGLGEVFGFRQSGLPEFATQDLVTDGNVLEVAREEAAAISSKSKDWQLLPEYQPLTAKLQLGEQDNRYFD